MHRFLRHLRLWSGLTPAKAPELIHPSRFIGANHTPLVALSLRTWREHDLVGFDTLEFARCNRDYSNILLAKDTTNLKLPHTDGEREVFIGAHLASADHLVVTAWGQVPGTIHRAMSLCPRYDVSYRNRENNFAIVDGAVSFSVAWHQGHVARGL